FLAYFASHAFFLVVVDDLDARSAVVAATLGVVAFLTARDLWRVRAGVTRAPATFLCAVLLLHGLFFSWRAGMILAGTRVGDVFGGGVFNVAPYVDGFVVANLLTFGLVIMVNQRAAADLREARDHFELLFEMGPDAVLITRLEDGVCRSVNSGFEELTGYRRGEILGSTTRDLPLYADASAREKLVDELRRTGGVTNVELVGLRKDGREFIGSLSGRVLDLDGEPHVLSVTRDVTERRVAEAALVRNAAEIRELNAGLERRVAERTAELAEKNRELEALVQSLAHDLRAPLRAIDGFSGILEEEQAARLDVDGRRLLGRVRSGAQRMDLLIRDLLEYVRAGSVEMRLEEVDGEPLARSAFEEAVPEEARGAWRFETGTLPPVRGDAALLRLALHHLVGNAVKFTASREGRTVEVRGSRGEGAVTWEVLDNGVGFDAAHGEKLFGLFQRLHAGEAFEGTGIGLAIVMRIARRHGGTVTAVGEVGRGARFTMTFPVEGGACV
ncbi:MAG: PAS domain S-box protein, partial [Thermoanaerobaculia bacterium]|nr:PAS domain S-box protein [Thermoanaerobaculia bacterium]